LLSDLNQINVNLKSAIARQDWRAAQNIVSMGLKLQPDNQSFLLDSVVINRELKNWRAAISAYSRVLNSNPSLEMRLINDRIKGEYVQKLPFLVSSERNPIFLVSFILVMSFCIACDFLDVFVNGGYFTFGFSVFVLFTELSYRMFLYLTHGVPGEPFAFPKILNWPTVEIYDKIGTCFHAVRGYDVIPNSTILRVAVSNGVIDELSTAVSDSNGNVGFTDEDIDPHAINILVVGDSFTSNPGNGSSEEALVGLEWPFFFKKALRKKGYTNIRIFNYARQGHGLLQMVDTAADLLGQHRFDIVIFAFIIQDLSRYRYWHTPRVVGGHLRSLRVATPEEDASIVDCRDQRLVDSRVTLQWAETLSKKLIKDDLMQALHRRHSQLGNRVSIRAIYLLSFARLYSWDRFFFGTPFLDSEVTARHKSRFDSSLTNYEADEKFMDAVKRVKKSGAKIVLVNLPTKNELIKGKLIFERNNEPDLLQSLQCIMEEPAWPLLQFIDKDSHVVEAQYQRSKNDFHPSRWAQELFGETLSSLFLSGHLGNLLRKSNSESEIQ